jgi:DNA-directed RNA polymerase specialized sigma24 family protein
MSPEGQGSITHCIPGLKAGDEGAARLLWDRYFAELVLLARARLGHEQRAVADEEDIALSAFQSLCAGVAHDRFARLSDREDLWKLLATITCRKVLDQVRHLHQRKRDTSRLRSSERFGGMERLADAGPPPDVAVAMTEQMRLLLACLGSESLRQVALLRMEGYGGDEIAARLGCNRRTVTRKLKLIRQTWLKHEPS